MSGSLQAVILGSGGWMPTGTRQTCAAVVRNGSDVLIIDAGTGLQRLLERPELVSGAENVHIVLTHFHLDHVVGLSYLPALPFARPPLVWGAGERLAGTPTRDILERLLNPPLFATTLADMVGDVRELSEGCAGLDSFAVSVRVQQRHSAPTIALRIGDALTYCTDTAPDPENVRFAAGCYTLLHEAWYAQDTSDDPHHTAAGDAARIARDAGVRHLVLIHISPLGESATSLGSAAQAVFPDTVVGADLATIPMP